MKNFYLLIIAGIFSLGLLQAQNRNTQLLGQRTYNSTTYGLLNDIWGHVDSLGNEYALVGTRKGVSIVDVSDPANLVEVFYTTGAQGIWRDIKTWNDHAYITNEASGGLMIIDMSNLPGTITSSDVYNYSGVSYPFTKAHNLYIDENGVAYLFGTNYTSRPTIFLDLTNDPKKPIELGYFNTYYLHDGMVRGDTMWGGAIYQGFFVAVDVSNKSNPVLLKTKSTSRAFTHNAWISDDGNTVFTTDEKSNGAVDSYDVSDLSNIEELDQYRSNPGQMVIPHNTHVYGNFVVTSYYRDGVTIVDATKPDVMVEVANYDTSPFLSGSGFNGCWGAYPYLPSGNLLASDMERGLFVIGVDYTQGVYIEGHVRAFNDSTNIANAKIISVYTGDTMFTNLKGQYKHSFPDSGLYRYAYSANGYLPDTIDIFMKSGVPVVSDVYLKSELPFKITGVIDGFYGDYIDGVDSANVLLKSKYHKFETLTDKDGKFSIDTAYEDVYEVVAWKWNFKSSCKTQSFVSGDSVNLVIPNDHQYDDINFDNAWVTQTLGNNGGWEKQEFTLDSVISTLDYPVSDVVNDCYRMAWVTGASGSMDHDVDGGPNTLESRVYENIGNNFLKFSYWFKNDAPAGSDDTLSINIIANNDTINLFKVHNAVNLHASKWVDTSVYLPSYTNAISFQLFLEIEDSGLDHLLEAGLDHVFTERSYVGIDVLDRKNNSLSVYPNPIGDLIHYELKGSDQLTEYRIVDAQGQIVQQGGLSDSIGDIQFDAVPQGMYLLMIESKNSSYSVRFLK